MEGFIKNIFFSARLFNKGAKSQCRDKLPAFICREEFKYGVVFVFDAEAGYALRPVDIEYPHRYAVLTGDTRKEIGKGLGEIIVFYYKFAVCSKIIFCFLYHSTQQQRVLCGAIGALEHSSK